MIREILEELYDISVTGSDDEYLIRFKGFDGDDGFISFKKVKKGWTMKPISREVYIINDANMYNIMETLSSYMTLNESKYGEVKTTFSEWAMEIIENWLDDPEKYKDYNTTEYDTNNFTDKSNRSE